MAKVSIEQQLEKMRRDWDQRAKKNARHYVESSREHWTDEDFFRSGEQTVAEEIHTDMYNVCQGKQPGAMRVLEIGCGAGRVTRALAKMFGEVHAVDVSGEMVQAARRALADFRNVFLYQNNGKDLRVVPEVEFDFAFSTIVFQHIPSRAVIESYVQEVHRLLRSGALFKFQVQGHISATVDPNDTWHGISFSPEQAAEMANRCGFEFRYQHGAGDQYYMLWFFKR